MEKNIILKKYAKVIFYRYALSIERSSQSENELLSRVEGQISRDSIFVAIARDTTAIAKINMHVIYDI